MGQGLKEFYFNGGHINLLVSPIFSKEDYEAIELGIKAQEDLVAQRMLEQFNIDEIKEEEGVNILSWLIYENRLDIRVVIKKDKSQKGIFHDKFSILIDEEDNRITYRGSMNESETALIDNYESIEVDCSWETAGYRRAVQREGQFDAIWSGKSNKWSTIPIPSAIKDSLLKIRKPILYEKDEDELFGGTEEQINNGVYVDEIPHIPKWLELRKYQKKAIAEWVKNENRGIFEMATGTGKTKTSLSAITKILEVYYSNNVKCGLVITVPYVVLLEQWVEELKEFNIHPITCYDSRVKWEKKLNDSIELFNKNVRNKLFVITINNTLISPAFQSCLRNIEGDFIFCADEMHHLTSDKMRQSLPQNAKYRLGLSATLMPLIYFAAELYFLLK